MNENKFDMVRISLKNDRTYFSDKPINNASDAVDVIVNELKDLDRECFIVLNVDQKGKPINASISSIGELSATTAHPREIFKSSILSNAARIILMHNHPSADLMPSKDDLKTTKRLKECGYLIGIPVIDHIIFSPDGQYMSMANAGLMEMDEALDNLLNSKVKDRESTYENDENSGLRIYRKIDGKGVYIYLNDGEMWEAYRMEMYRGYEKYIIEDLSNRKGETLYGVKVENILSNQWLIGAIAEQYNKEISYTTADDGILQAAYENVISGYVASEAEKSDFAESMENDKLLDAMFDMISKAKENEFEFENSKDYELEI